MTFLYEYSIKINDIESITIFHEIFLHYKYGYEETQISCTMPTLKEM